MKIILPAILCSLWSHVLLSQNLYTGTYSNTPLIEILNDLESQSSAIKFSYARQLVESKTASLAFQNTSITDVLKQLSSTTGLNFEQLSTTQIIVTRNKKICGRVLDSNTKEPLPLATIALSDSTGITSDGIGTFSFKVGSNAEMITASIKYLGYEPQSISILVGSPCVDVLLKPASASLNEVVILGYVTTGIDKNKDGSVTVDTEKLGILPGLVTPDIAQSVQLIPGITSLDESASGIQIRGGAPDQNLIFLDHIKLYNTGYFYGMFSTFNPYATQKAKIFKSGASPAYGDRVAGIIDISTNSDIPEKSTGGFGLDGLSADGFIKTPLSDKIAINLYARRSYADVWKSPTYDGYATKIFSNSGLVTNEQGEVLNVENDDDYDINSSKNAFYFHDINAKVLYKPTEKDHISVSGLYTKNRLDFTFEKDDERKVDDLLTTNKGLSFNWDRRSSVYWKHQLTSYYSKYASDYQNDEIENGMIEEVSLRSNNISDFGINYGLTNYISDKHSTTIGYQYSRVNVHTTISKHNPLDLTDPDDNYEQISNVLNSSHALYAQYTYSFENSGLASFGVRGVQYSSLSSFYIAPRFNLEYPLSDIIRIKASIEKRYQPISQLVEFNQTELRLENNLWVLSDDEQFPILSSAQVSSGFLVDYNGWTLDADGYYKKIEGLTSYTNGFSNPIIDLSEGESKILGLDVLLKKQIDNYRVWAGYTYNDIRYTFQALQPEAFPGNNDITHNFRISNTYQLKGWQFSLGWSYRTGEPFTPIATYDESTALGTFGDVNSHRLQNFHRLDASIIYDFNLSRDGKWQGRFGLSVLNLSRPKISLQV